MQKQNLLTVASIISLVLVPLSEFLSQTCVVDAGINSINVSISDSDANCHIWHSIKNTLI